jgi:hypothetical protein
MLVRAGDLLKALQFLHAASSAFGSKYFANYFSLESENGLLRMRTSSPNGAAEATIEPTDEGEPISVVTTTKIFRLLQFIPQSTDVELIPDEEEIKIRADRNTWHIPLMNVEAPFMPELPEEAALAILEVESKWGMFQSFLSAVAPYTEGSGSYQQPSVYFQIDPTEGICYGVGTNRAEALIERIPVEANGQAEILLPYETLKPIINKATPSRVEIYHSGAKFVGETWWLYVPALSLEIADQRRFRRIYEKVNYETIRVSLALDRTELLLAMQRLQALADLSGAVKYMTGSIEVHIQPHSEREIHLSSYALGGALLSEEVIPTAEEVVWPEDIEPPLRIGSRSIQNALNAFNKSTIVQFDFAYDSDRKSPTIARVTSPLQPHREVYFALLMKGESS